MKRRTWNCSNGALRSPPPCKFPNLVGPWIEPLSRTTGLKRSVSFKWMTRPAPIFGALRIWSSFRSSSHSHLVRLTDSSRLDSCHRTSARDWDTRGRRATKLVSKRSSRESRRSTATYRSGSERFPGTSSNGTHDDAWHMVVVSCDRVDNRRSHVETEWILCLLRIMRER